MAVTEADLSRDPDEYDAVASVFDGRMLEVNTAMPGVVERYDAATGRADVSPVIKRVYVVDGKDQAFDQPVITSVPVCFPRGGGFAMTFPLKKGDPVLLVFSQRSIDRWTDTDGKTKHDCEDDRRFDLSDAIAIPGLYTFKAPIQTAHADNLVLAKEDGSCHFQITTGGEFQMKGGPFRLGSDAANKALALAEKCDSRLSDLEAFAATHMHPTAAPGPPSPGVLPNPFIPPVGQTTGSTKVFTDA